jgi:hypothetical protein
MEADRGLADVLHDLKGSLSFLLSDRIAQEAPKDADVVTKGKILLWGSIGADQGHGLRPFARLRLRASKPHPERVSGVTQVGKRMLIIRLSERQRM